MAKKKAVRNNFTPEVKAEALRLIREEGYTAKQAAEYAGCSTFSINQWKAAAKSGKKKAAAKESTNGTATTESTVKSVKKTKKTRRRRRKGATVKTAITASVAKPLISFDEFVQNYWNEYEGASNVLRLPADIMPKAIQYVNDVLRYAYDQFSGQ